MKQHIFALPPGEGSKRQISSNFKYKVNFKNILYLTLWVFAQIKDIKHTEWVFHSVVWVMPQGENLGVKNSIFPNMVMWHIKLKGIVSRTGYN